jgi:FkbM family methyltransferase
MTATTMTKTRAIGERMSRVLRRYYLGHNHPMKLRLWGWLRRATGYAPLTVPLSGGGLIAIDERDNHQMEILRTGAYEPELWDTLGRFAVKDEVLWDVGAFVGSLSIQALHDPRVAGVHAFEPHPQQAERLEYNLRLNADSRWAVHRLALGDRDEQRRLFHYPFPLNGGASLAHDFGAGSFAVQCRCADSLVFGVGVPAPTLMKIDVEGWELRLLQGARRLLAEKPPRAIVFEASTQKGGDGAITDTRLTELLGAHGYRVEWIKRYSGEVWHRENYLATREGR